MKEKYRINDELAKGIDINQVNKRIAKMNKEVENLPI